MSYTDAFNTLKRDNFFVSKNKVNVLLVDDHPENILVLKATLAPLNLNLVEANSGKEALKYLLEQDFAVILLDVMMPEMDGFETARLIREREKSRHTPIIFITAMFLGDADAFKGYSVGAVDYIMKPFFPEIIRSKVSVFVELFNKSEEIKKQAEVIRQIQQRDYERKLDETTARMQAETEQVRAEHRAIRNMVQQAPMGFALLKNDKTLSDFNPIFAEQYTFQHGPEEEVMGKRLSDLVPWLPESLFAAIEKNEPFHFRQFRLQTDDNERYCDLATWPILKDDGSSSGIIILSVDITERVKLDQQRNDFVATLAHDLQTPVIASDRALSLLLGKAANILSPDLLNLITMLKKNNQNLLHMIESLLDVYHYEEGARALYFDDVDLNLLVNTCVDELTPLANQQGLDLSASLPSERVLARADRTAVRRVLTNLLDNAIKFTPVGGKIEVGLTRDDECAILEVTDTGVGVPAQDLERLFDRYWHGRNHKSYKASSGLGLYLCRQIADAHGGRIECASEVGRMTSFKVYLPLEQKELADVTGVHQIQPTVEA